MYLAVRTSAFATCTLLVAVGVAPQGVPVALEMTPRSVAVSGIELAALPSWLQWVDNGTALLSAQIAAVANLVQNEIDDPLPIAATVAQNQIINAQNLGTAALNSAQVLVTGLVRVPDLLLNAVFDAIANPLSIPLILSGLVTTFINTATGAVTPLVSALTSLVTTTVTRAFGAGNAVIANVVPIGAALIGVPIAIGNAVIGAAAAVVGSVLTLNPFNVIGAVGDGLVGIEAAAANSVIGVAAAVGKLRSDVRSAIAYPRPAAAVRPSRSVAPRPAATADRKGTPADDGPQTSAKGAARRSS